MLTAPAMHRPIMVAEVLRCLRPEAGELAVDCTLGGGGHARALLGGLQPGGHVIGIDRDPIELPRTLASLRRDGFGPDTFTAHRGNFAQLRDILNDGSHQAADIIFADLGVSAMQHDDPARGFSYKAVGPLDMRMDPTRGAPASALIAREDADTLTRILRDNADEPHASLIAGILKRQPVPTTHAIERFVRTGLNLALPDLPKAAVKVSVRRTLQALRIAVNDEFAALEALLASLPTCLAPGGRVAIITFHSGEDRRVKKAFKAGFKTGTFAAIADTVIRSSREESRMNRRSMAAKLRWAQAAGGAARAASIRP
jgi:16S rRNA (cytosine1402-N4)-methyltransferase